MNDERKILIAPANLYKYKKYLYSVPCLFCIGWFISFHYGKQNTKKKSKITLLLFYLKCNFSHIPYSHVADTIVGIARYDIKCVRHWNRFVYFVNDDALYQVCAFVWGACMVTATFYLLSLYCLFAALRNMQEGEVHLWFYLLYKQWSYGEHFAISIGRPLNVNKI